MKNKTTKTSPILIRICAALLSSFLISPAMMAQITDPPSGIVNFEANTTYNPVSRQAPVTTVYNIADGVTVSLINADTDADGGVFNLGSNKTLTIGPSGTLGTGHVIFADNKNKKQGGIFYVSSMLTITNATFRNNSSGAYGGILRNTTGAGNITFTNALFENNRATGGGVFANYSVLYVISSTLSGNYTTTYNGNGGVLLNQNSATGKKAEFTEAAFISNRAGNYGGVATYGNTAGARGTLVMRDVSEITNNWAGVYGGALFDGSNRDGGYFINMIYTGSTTQTDFTYSGNWASGTALPNTTVTTQALATGSHALLVGDYLPKAKAGGFYFSNSNSLLTFDIAQGISLTIGSTANAAAFDSFATSNTGTGALIEKTGGGRLVFHADNSYYQGTIQVDGGTLLMGNQKSLLGGVIEISSGATFGGSGTLATFKQDGTLFTGRTSITATTGATIRVGMDTSTSAETLTVKGNVTLKDGAILGHDLFSGGTASILLADTITQIANAKINLGLLASGTFVLAEWANGGIDASKLSLTVNGGAETARSSGTLFVQGSQLKVSNKVSSLAVKWTGDEGNTWASRSGGKNWSDGQVNAEKNFRDADRVIFDGIADAGAPSNRNISIASTGVVVADMLVSGSADYTFKGTGGITADATQIDGTIITGSSVLSKSGANTLTFENTGANNFTNGINISGGIIAFNNTEQLKTGAAGISFTDSATLRVNAGISGTLAAKLAIAAGKTAVIDVTANNILNHDGTIASAASTSILQKTGDGTLQLFADNSSYGGTVIIDKGSLVLANMNTKLGGKISVAAGATLGGSGEAGTGGDVAVASGAKITAGSSAVASGTLTLNNLKVTGGAIFQFDLFNTPDGAIKQSDRIMGAGTAQISGTNIIDITTLASGTFNLGNLTGLAANYQVTLNNMVLPSAGRLSATVNNTPGYLQLITVTDKSRNIRWTGASGVAWNSVAANWSASDGINQYSYGDHALFDGAADAAHSENRTINIEGTQVSLSDMTVDAGVDYTFGGNGSIIVKKSYVMSDGTPAEITNAQGKLTKSGTGTLTFANNNRNFFEGGIDINGGAIAFTRADQLDTTGTAITFGGNAMLRANADDIQLANTINISAASVGALDSNNHTLAFTGTMLGDTTSTFLKTGVGIVILNADSSEFFGTIAVNQGTLRMGAADVLTNSSAAMISLHDGAILDLDGHNQSISSLSGTGTVALGSATLEYTIASGTASFGGGFTGEGNVSKKGAGKWLLTGASNHTGNFAYDEGTLGVANNKALGAGTVNVNATDAEISVDADNITINNNIKISSNKLTINSGSGQVAFSGKIDGSVLVTKGSGTITLSGNNSYGSLTVENARTVARSADAISGNVTLSTMLEFQNVSSGQLDGAIRGSGHLLFTSSTLSLLGSNNLPDVVVDARSDITAAAADALGGSNANVFIKNNSQIRITGTASVKANNILVDGGAITFGDNKKMGSLSLIGQLEFANGGEVRLGALLPTGIYTAAIADGGIPSMPDYNPNQNGMFMVLDILNGNTLQITAYNMALEPGKDIAVGFDSMIISMRSVYAHISEEFLTPLISREAGQPAGSLWFRMVGSYATYGDDYDHLGYTDNTYAGMVGYDWISSKERMLGLYFGFSNTKLETNNNASTGVHIPHGGIYGALRHGDFYLSGDLAIGLGDAETERREEQGNHVTGSYNLNTLGASIEAGYLLHVFKNGYVRPSVGLHYMNLSFRDYQEEGKGAVRLNNLNTYTLQAVLGCMFTSNITLPGKTPGMLDIRLGWRRSLKTSATDVRATLIEYPNASFDIRGDEYDPDGVTGGIGVRVAISKRTTFGIAYDFDYIPAGRYDTDTIRNTFNALLRFSW